MCARISGVRWRPRSGRQTAFLGSGWEPQQASAALGPAACAATLVARFFVIFAAAHLFFDSRVFNQLSEPLDGIRNRFMLAQTQLDHKTLLATLNVGNGGAALESPDG
jgi:hypothetical protein